MHLDDIWKKNAPRRAHAGWTARLMEACRGPRALPALGLLSFLESSFLPIPIDLAMIPICLARRQQFWLIVLVGAAGSVVGAIAGYMIGAFLMEVVGNWLINIYGMREGFSQFEVLYAEKGWLAVAVAGITPIPFKVAAIVSGAAGMRFDLFFCRSFGIRFFRFALIALMIRIFGPRLQKMLESHGGKFTLLMVAVMMFGFLLVPMIM